MKQRMVVVGGGYAGLNMVNSLKKQFAGEKDVQITLIDKEVYHLRKVLLFQRAVDEAQLKVPFSAYFDDTVEVIQAELSAVDPRQQHITIRLPDGQSEALHYDRLILCLGSKIVSAAPEQGGISLTDTDSGDRIRLRLEQNVHDARLAPDESERRRLLSAAVVGGGITGTETASELVYGLRRNAAAAGLDPALVTVTLINSQPRLLEAAPPQVSKRLERELGELGVHVMHSARAEAYREAEGVLLLHGGDSLTAGTCVWTLGLRPNPLVQQLGLPVVGNGKLQIDARYHVMGNEGIYAIGDCAHVRDHVTGKPDGMTCKEAIPQAMRLTKILKDELAGIKGPAHASYINLFCIGLGPDKGFVWIQKWGMNIMLTGKVGRYIRRLTWDIASLMNRKSADQFLMKAGRKQA